LDKKHVCFRKNENNRSCAGLEGLNELYNSTNLVASLNIQIKKMFKNSELRLYPVFNFEKSNGIQSTNKRLL